MTVRELIEDLKTFPSELEIHTGEYSGPRLVIWSPIERVEIHKSKADGTIVVIS